MLYVIECADIVTPLTNIHGPTPFESVMPGLTEPIRPGALGLLPIALLLRPLRCASRLRRLVEYPS